MPRPYQVCSRCVMDTSDSRITFDQNGVCDHCNGFEVNVRPKWHPDERGRAVLVVGKNLGGDSLQRWLGEQGWPTTRLGSAKGFRVLEVRRDV